MIREEEAAHRQGKKRKEAGAPPRGMFNRVVKTLAEPSFESRFPIYLTLDKWLHLREPRFPVL